uniref:Putative secreted protein n=1 Tax=Anopheles darlingi TaxID=43151 RepID=A0A2M4D6M6_ANODA
MRYMLLLLLLLILLAPHINAHTDTHPPHTTICSFCKMRRSMDFHCSRVLSYYFHGRVAFSLADSHQTLDKHLGLPS